MEDSSKSVVNLEYILLHKGENMRVSGKKEHYVYLGYYMNK